MRTDRQRLYTQAAACDYNTRIPEAGSVVLAKSGNSAQGTKDRQFFVSFNEDDTFYQASGEGYLFHDFNAFLEHIPGNVEDPTTKVIRDRNIRQRAMVRAMSACDRPDLSTLPNLKERP